MYVGGAGDRQLCGRHETMEKLPLGPDGRGRLIQGGNNMKEWRQEEQSVQVVPWSWHYTLSCLRGTSALSHPELARKMKLWILIQERSQTQ